MLFPMHFFESRAYEQSAPPPAAVSFHVIFFLCIWRQDTGGWSRGSRSSEFRFILLFVHHRTLSVQMENNERVANEATEKKDDYNAEKLVNNSRIDIATTEGKFSKRQLKKIKKSQKWRERKVEKRLSIIPSKNNRFKTIKIDGTKF